MKMMVESDGGVIAGLAVAALLIGGLAAIGYAGAPGQPPAVDGVNSTPGPVTAVPSGTDSGGDASAEVRVIESSPGPGLSNATLQTETRESVTFLADLPRNRTERNQTVVDAATRVCNAHDLEAPETGDSSSSIDQETYRDTYRVENTAGILRESLGADIDTAAVASRMEGARESGDTAADYAPVIGSYDRLHTTSCAVKNGTDGSKAEFYTASAAFAVDLALIQHSVVFSASFAATQYTADEVGMIRLARVCGYECVGVVQSESHRTVRDEVTNSTGGFNGTAGTVNLTTGEWNESTQASVSQYLEQTNNMTLVNGTFVTEREVTACVRKTVDADDISAYVGEYGTETGEMLHSILEDDTSPHEIDIRRLVEISDIRQCVS